MTLSLKFTDTEVDLLARTADALSAYMGKPILAEVIDDQEAGFEWVLFAIPLAPSEATEGKQLVQVGGPGARFVGNLGGLTPDPTEPLECELLWAIQLSELDGARYIKVDGDGEEAAWADALADVLPFALTGASDEAVDDEHDEDDDDDDLLPSRG